MQLDIEGSTPASDMTYCVHFRIAICNCQHAIRGRPLIIWGGGRGEDSRRINLFIPQECLLRISCGRPFEIYFFLEKGPRNFFFLNFLWASPHIINGHPLTQDGIRRNTTNVHGLVLLNLTIQLSITALQHTIEK